MTPDRRWTLRPRTSVLPGPAGPRPPRRPAGRAAVGFLAGPVLVVLLLVGGCARIKGELGMASPRSGPSTPAEVAAPTLPPRSPAPCTVAPPDVAAEPRTPGSPIDEALIDTVQRYLDARPDEAGGLIGDESVPGGRIYAGFVSDWCGHRDALRQLVGGRIGVDVFAVVQPYQAGQRLANQIFGSSVRLAGVGVRIATTAVDVGTGFTSVTTPDDPWKGRAAILRELELPADAPIMVTRGPIPVAVDGGSG